MKIGVEMLHSAAFHLQIIEAILIECFNVQCSQIGQGNLELTEIRINPLFDIYFISRIIE